MKTTYARIIKQDKSKIAWRMYYRVAYFAHRLDELKDAAEVKKQKLASAPLELLPMVF